MHPVFNTFKDAAGIPRDQGIGPWNDARVRTKDDVLAAFDRAIAAAEMHEAT